MPDVHYFLPLQSTHTDLHAMQASHILVPDRAQCHAIRTELREDEARFAELAVRHSICPSGQQGGSLGTFQPGQMVPAFEQAVRELEPHAISECVPTAFGYHVVRRDHD